MITYDQRYAPPMASLSGLQTLILAKALILTGHSPEAIGDVFGIGAGDAIDLMDHACEANSNREFPPLTAFKTGLQ